MKVSLRFSGTVSAGSEKTLASTRLNFPYTLKRIRVARPPGVNRTVEMKVFIAPSPDTPTSGEPAGTNALAQHSQVDYLVGDDAVDEFEHEIRIEESGSYIKIYANNADGFDHTIDVTVTLDRPGRE